MMLKRWFIRSEEYGLTRKMIALFVALSMAASLTEVFGIAVFLPIAQLVQAGNDPAILAEGSGVWRQAMLIAGKLQINLNVGLLLLVACFLFGLRQIMVYLRTIYIAGVKVTLLRNVRMMILEEYSKATTEHHDQLASGGLQAMLTGEAAKSVRWLLAPLEIVSLLILNGVYLGLLFTISWVMTLVITVMLFLTGLLVRGWIKQSRLLGRRSTESALDIGKFLGQRLRAWRFPRLANTEEAELTEFRKLTAIAQKVSYAENRLSAKTESVVEPIIIFSSIAFLYFAVETLSLGIENIGIFVLILLRLTPVGKIIIEKIQKINIVRGALEILDRKIGEMRKNQERHSRSGVELREINQISFQEVSYRYPDASKEALKKISFSLGKDSVLAIVGPSGSGKSTLIDLFPRLRSPSAGKIFVDDVDADRIKLSELRKAISYLPQETRIFSGTIAEHVGYGKPGATRSEIESALELAGAGGMISYMQKGIDTGVGEFGVNLSGGEKQRVDLARALLSDASVLILDEPTSSLDAESAAIFEGVLADLKESTSLMIVMVTHDLRIARAADQILVLQSGVISELGTHQQLTQGGGWYCEMLRNADTFSTVS